jgi:catechol 2,3-dioxygenase-like lactoylglutathione lyase family enzyme
MEGVIGLITILTDDLKPMRAFYSDLLGFEVIEDLENYVEYRNPGVRFAICTREVMYETTGHESYREERGSHAFELAFPVGEPDDVYRVYGEVLAGGATPIKGPEIMTWGRKTAFIGDPDGNIHEIYSYKPEDFE